MSRWARLDTLRNIVIFLDCVLGRAFTVTHFNIIFNVVELAKSFAMDSIIEWMIVWTFINALAINVIYLSCICLFT